MKTLTKEIFLGIVTDYLEGKATDGEIKFLEQYYDQFSDEPEVLEQFSEEEKEALGKKMRAGIDQRIEDQAQAQSNQFIAVPRVPLYRQRWVQIAAVFTVMVSVVFYFTRQSDHDRFVVTNKQTISDIAPGGNKAILTLSNGSRISLSEAAKGKIADPHGASINNAATGQLVYSGAGVKSEELSYNTIETRNGGQYQIILPDGTKVWINSASSLKYPIAFNGNERVVQLSGEAYFEVSKNKAKPFKVITASQVVTVLGTHFNINAYSNEPLTKTTLLEGLVKVNKINSDIAITIKPGQQASVKGGNIGSSAIQIQTVNTDEATAWKNGYFMFDDESLESILRKVTRWYDVDIVNRDPESSQKRFSGTISRYSNVSQVLKKLELTESVKFKIEGRKIIVIP